MPLDIIIAGAGVAGITASITLTDKGHKVTLYERRDDDDKGISTSGIQLQPNAVRVLERVGALDAVTRVSNNNGHSDLRDSRSGDTLGLVDFNRRGGVRYGPRTQFKQALLQEAIQRGVVLHKGVGVESVDQDRSRPVVRLSDGSQVAADLIIGADGAWSRVRKSLYPAYKPSILSSVVFQLQVPEDELWASQTTADVDRNNPAVSLWFADDRFAFCAHEPHARLFDMQLIDADYPLDKDPNPEIRLGWVSGTGALQERFSDYALGFRQLLEKTDRYYKWRLVEVTDMPSWSNQAGNVVLIGDSSHAMIPTAGQGSAMGVEDAAVIAEVLDGAKPGDDLKSRLELFERLRRPRCELIRKYAFRLAQLWTTGGKLVANLRQNKTSVNNPAYAKAKPDKTAPFNTPAFEKWLDLYDAEAEVKMATDPSGKLQARL